MAYFKINEVDYSSYVNKMSIDRKKQYNSQTNAAGDTLVDYINSKYTVQVGIIPLEDVAMKKLEAAIESIQVSISFRNPQTGALTTIDCIIPDDGVEYYTIQSNKVSYKAFNLKFIQL